MTRTGLQVGLNKLPFKKQSAVQGCAANNVREADSFQTPGQAIRLPVLVGLGTVLIFVAIFTAWSLLAPLAGAVIASGRIAPEGATRTVQHKEGGIIGQILVRDGQKVEAGQALVELADVAILSQRNELEALRTSLEIRQDRLRAEWNGDRIWKPRHSEGNTVGHALYDIRQAAENERNLFQMRTRVLIEELKIYDSRIEQTELTIKGLHEQNQEVDNQINLIAQEQTNVQTLVDKGLEKMPRLLAVKRALHQLKERRASNSGKIAQLTEQIGDYRQRKLHVQSQRREEISRELADVQNRQGAIAEKLVTIGDVIRRAIITAPVSGIVANMQVNTEGGVIAPGDSLMDIVPEFEPKIIEAKVDPIDIDNVEVWQNALVHLSSYSMRFLDPMPAFVETLSADLTVDEASQESFYVARIRVEERALRELPEDVRLTAGMPVEVYITTEPRTVVTYLLDPLIETVRRGMREP